ncbi:MAG TPA: hypothetical protein VEA63_05215, partial [Opitutus sp.]|nr:hypothetical protein [Opitutus sp.]
MAAEETKSASPRRVLIEGLNERIEDLRWTDFEGRDVSSRLVPQSKGENITVSLARPDQFIVKPKSISTVSALEAGKKEVMPGGIVVPLVAAPDGSTEPSTAWFRLTLEVSPTPATWDDAARSYLTRLTFGLRRPPQLPAEVQLEQPVLIKLGFEGMTAGEVAPVRLEAAGLENEQTVDLHFNPRTAAPKVLVRSTLSDVNV